MLKEIVGDDLFNRANKVRESRKCRSNSSANQLNRTDILFEGLLYHKCCGSRLYLNRDYVAYKMNIPVSIGIDSNLLILQIILIVSFILSVVGAVLAHKK